MPRQRRITCLKNKKKQKNGKIDYFIVAYYMIYRAIICILTGYQVRSSKPIGHTELNRLRG